MDTTDSVIRARRLRTQLLERVAAGELAPGRAAAPEGEVQPPLPVVEGYDVRECVAMGGMGVVYMAIERKTQRRVALKLVRPDQRSTSAAERLLREVRALCSVQHPGIVAYIDHGTTAEGSPYLATEWLEGEDLEHYLRRGPLPVEQVLALARRLLGALAAAHEWGVVHRDIKPANILLVGGRPDDARLLDFGIARVALPSPTLTQPGNVIGTPAYMAPEQARGDPDIDHRADLFSLGAVLYECVTGRPAFPGEHVMAVLAKVLVESPPPLRESLPQVPPALDELVGRLLSKDADDRSPTAQAALDALPRVGADLRPVPRSAPVGLGEQEQSFHSVLFIRGDLDTEAPPPPLARIAREHRGRSLPLADGTRLIQLERGAVPSDQAANAARCALAVHQVAPQLSIAVVSGHAVVTGRAVVGRMLDRGAELLLQTPAGCIRLDQATAGLLDARFVVGDDEDGLTLAAQRDRARGVRPLLGRVTPLVGRSRELAFLEAALHESMAEPCASALVVVAEAGVGKSRIRHEVVTDLRSRADPAFTVLVGHGDPLRTQAPFAMMARALYAVASLEDGEPASARRDKLRERIARTVAPRQLSRVLLYLGELCSANGDEPAPDLVRARADASTMRERIQSAWITWLRAECEVGPVVLVLEDLQWGDAATVQLVDVLLEVLADAPLLVLTFARPSLYDRFPNLWRWRDVERLELAPLPARAARKLVRGALGDAVRSRDVERIVDCARGNALFLEELIRIMAADSTAALSDSVLGIMHSRLEALGPDERHVLRAASVLGTTTWRGAVQQLLGAAYDAATVDRILARLVRGEWLVARERTYIPDEVEYVFRHALLRDTAYATLTDDDRALGHRLVAQWLEQTGEHEPIVVAEHYQRGLDHASAARWFATAADQAFERNEYEVAGTIAERGLVHGPPGEIRGRLLLRCAEVHGVSGRHQDAADAALAALAELPRSSPRWVSAAGEAAQASARIGDAGRVKEIANALMKAEPMEGGSAVNLVGLVRAAYPLAAAGEAVTAWWLVDTIVRVISSMPDPGAQGPLHSARALRALVTGSLGTVYKEMKVAAAAFERVGSHRTALEHLAGAGFFLLELGCLPQGETLLRATIERAAGLGLEHLSAVARHNLGRRIGESGRLEEGLELEHQALAKFQRHANTRMQGLTSCHIAWLLLMGGHAEESAAHVNAALDLLKPHFASRLIALATRAQVLLRIGELGEALADARQAIEGLGKLPRVQEGESFIRVTWAEVLMDNERVGEAHQAIAAAQENLHGRAERIMHETLRRSFLRDVPENARIEQLAARWRAS